MKKSLEELEKNISTIEDDYQKLVEQQEVLEEKLCFLAVSAIMELMNQGLPQNKDIKCVFYSATDDYGSFLPDFCGCIFKDIENDKKVKNSSSERIIELLYRFSDTITEHISNHRSPDIVFYNDEQGRHDFLKKIIGEEYLKWIHNQLDSDLDEKSLVRKNKI